MNSYDLVVVGGTPAGIMAAVAAARLGSTVALTEYHGHIGGMSASGLGKSDIENRAAIAGLFKEFVHRVHQFYIGKYGRGSVNEKLCREGYYYEPSVAERVFNQLIEEEGIELYTNCRIKKVVANQDVLLKVRLKHRATGRSIELSGKIFVDATYEGDLYALAGAGYRLGREGRATYGEAHAGRIFMDYQDNRILQGSTGDADENLPAYTYRLCLTDDPGNSHVLKAPPPGYNRNNYTAYLTDLTEGRLGAPKILKEGHGYYPRHFDTILRVFSFTEIPNRKYDVNINPRPLGFPFPELNKGYPEADWEERERIAREHRELALGLLYFIQNDSEVPEEHRRMANKYHLPLDEFRDNGHFPWQLYVREARRLKGKYTLTENDLERTAEDSRSAVFYDSVIAGEFPIDSFPVTRECDKDRKVLEGYIGMMEIKPYQVPLRIMMPASVNRLIVPVAGSTSHIAYSTIRMEPLWMGLGQVAGILAHISIKMRLDPASVPINLLQKQLLQDGQVLSYFFDVDPVDKAFESIQFWGTKGFFTTYKARSNDFLVRAVLIEWIKIFTKELGQSAFDMVWEGGDHHILVDEFKEMMAVLQEKIFSSDKGLEKNSLKIRDDDWLYDDRKTDAPLRRGEACMAFFNLYFLWKTYD